MVDVFAGNSGEQPYGLVALGKRTLHASYFLALDTSLLSSLHIYAVIQQIFT